MTLEATIAQISSNIVGFLDTFIPIVAVLAVIVNCCHFVILTRKSISLSSMNTLLIAIAIVDILSSILYVKQGIWSILSIWSDDCEVPGYSSTVIVLILRILNDICRRCSTWFGVSLAVIRTVSVKKAARNNVTYISDPKFALKVIFPLAFLSALIAIPYAFRYRIIKGDPYNCVTSSGANVSVTDLSISEFVNKVVIDGTARTVHILLTGVFGQLIPSFLIVTFAIILIHELRKPEKLISTSVQTEKISKMVIYMTVTFLVIELPIGIGKLVNAMQTGSTIPHNSNKIFHYFYVPMTMFHCFICFLMSSQYRRTACRLFGLERKATVSFASSSNKPSHPRYPCRLVSMLNGRVST